LDDRAGRPAQVGGLVHHDRRIARTGHDRPLAAVQRGTRHRGAAGDADQLDFTVLEDHVCRLQRGLGDQADQVVDPHVAVNGFVVAPHALGRHPLAAGMRVDDQRVAGRDHADRIARDRGQRVGYRGDGADHAEGRVLDDRQAAVAAVHLAPQELDAGAAFAQRFQLFDLVLQAADLGFVHLHRAQFDALVDRDPADVADDPFAVLQAPLAQPLVSLGRRRDGFAGVAKDPVAALVAGAADGRDSAHFGQDLSDHVADQCFVDLHAVSPSRE